MERKITKMDYRNEKIILGFMRIADKTQEEAVSIIQTAYDAGIRIFDHADIYGRDGKSELVFTKAFKETGIQREDIFLQSKVGIRQDYGMYDLSEAYILKSVDQILARLDTDYLDMLLLHRPDALMDVEETARALTKLKNEGKVKHFGVSNFNHHQISLLQSKLDFPLEINQIQFSLLHSIIIDEGINVNLDNKDASIRASGILEYAQLNNIKLQSWSPFQHGFIEGPFIDNEAFPEVNEALEEIAKVHGVSKTTIAAAWILRHPANIQVVAGTMTPSRIKDIAKAQDITLTRNEWYTLYKATGKLLP